MAESGYHGVHQEYIEFELHKGKIFASAYDEDHPTECKQAY